MDLLGEAGADAYTGAAVAHAAMGGSVVPEQVNCALSAKNRSATYFHQPVSSLRRPGLLPYITAGAGPRDAQAKCRFGPLGRTTRLSAQQRGYAMATLVRLAPLYRANRGGGVAGSSPCSNGFEAARAIRPTTSSVPLRTPIALLGSRRRSSRGRAVRSRRRKHALTHQGEKQVKDEKNSAIALSGIARAPFERVFPSCRHVQ